MDYARQLIVSVLVADERVMKELPNEALLLEFGDSAPLDSARCWIEDYMETRGVLDKMNTTFFQVFDRESIPIPMPQREVVVRRYQVYAKILDAGKSAAK